MGPGERRRRDPQREDHEQQKRDLAGSPTHRLPSVLRRSRICQRAPNPAFDLLPALLSIRSLLPLRSTAAFLEASTPETQVV
jgi:hypothetical protein